jgi:hypothetical protein
MAERNTLECDWVHDQFFKRRSIVFFVLKLFFRPQRSLAAHAQGTPV